MEAGNGDAAKNLIFLSLPDELCVVTTQLDNTVDGLEEALKVLKAAANGAGKKPRITWVAPRPDFNKFQLQQLNVDHGATKPSLATVGQRVMTTL